MLIGTFGERSCVKWMKIQFCGENGKDLCVLSVRPAAEPIFKKSKLGRAPLVSASPFLSLGPIAFGGGILSGAPRLDEVGGPTGADDTGQLETGRFKQVTKRFLGAFATSGGDR